MPNAISVGSAIYNNLGNITVRNFASTVYSGLLPARTQVALLAIGLSYPAAERIAAWGSVSKAGFWRNMTAHTFSQALIGGQIYTLTRSSYAAIFLTGRDRETALSAWGLLGSYQEGAIAGAIWGGVLGLW